MQCASPATSNYFAADARVVGNVDEAFDRQIRLQEAQAVAHMEAPAWFR